MHTVGHQLQAIYEEGFAQAAADKMEPAACIRALGNPLEALHFSSEELTLLLSIQDYELLNDLMNLDNRHNMLVALQAKYNEMRADLERELAGAEMLGPTLGKTALDREQYARVAPKIAALNDLAAGMLTASQEQAESSTDVLDRLGDLLRTKIDLHVHTQLAQNRVPPSDPAAVGDRPSA
jgi:hypothetical protein